jgi:hypothetical protein
MNVQNSGGLGAVSSSIPEWLLILILVVLIALGVAGIWKVWVMFQG